MHTIDNQRFEQARQLILGGEKTRLGIGTLSEKTTHAILKHYYEPDARWHEVPVAGSVADVCDGARILEIQTAGFNRLREKLDKFLPLMPVTIIYPIPHVKYVSWIDPETGAMSDRHKSPKKGSGYEAFRELYRIRPYLRHPNLNICLVLLDMDEFRLLDGWSRNKKRGSHRYDRIPLSIHREIWLEQPEDYMQLLPIELPERFTTKDYAKAAKVSSSLASTGLLMLMELGIVRRVGKTGNAYLYEVAE